MKKWFLIIFSLFVLCHICPAAEAPCGIDKEAQRILAVAKSELGLYSAVITPHINKILETGGLDVSASDTTFDQLASQARKDGYDIRNLVSQLKAFNRLVVGCKEYPEYLKRLQAEKERMAKAREAKRQAELALQKKKEEEERLARLEAERVENEKEIKRLEDLENERRRQEAERRARQEAEFQARVEEKAAELKEGCVIQIPSSVSGNSSVGASLLGKAKIFTSLRISGNCYVLALKDIREVSDTSKAIDPVDVLIKATKKRKKYEITLTKEDLLRVNILAMTEKQYRRR